MANLKDLRNRIDSVKSTEKITSAMKMVAASRLRRAQQLIGKSSFYYNNLLILTERLVKSIKSEYAETERTFELPTICQDKPDAKNYLLVVFASDRGLCGSYNSNVVKEVIKRIEQLKAQGKRAGVITIGRKAKDILKRKYAENIVGSLEGIASKGADYSESHKVLDFIASKYFGEDYDVCELIYSRFHSAINRETITERLLPLCFPELSEDKMAKTEDSVNGAYYEYEPGKEAALEKVINMFIEALFFQAIVNSQASEHGARMTSMDGATRNAKDMISKLTLKYNRIRQTAITTELTEIISGAEAI